MLHFYFAFIIMYCRRTTTRFKFLYELGLPYARDSYSSGFFQWRCVRFSLYARYIHCRYWNYLFAFAALSATMRIITYRRLIDLAPRMPTHFATADDDSDLLIRPVAGAWCAMPITYTYSGKISAEIISLFLCWTYTLPLISFIYHIRYLVEYFLFII